MNRLLMIGKDWTPWLTLAMVCVSYAVGARIHFSVGALLFAVMVSAIQNSFMTDTAVLVLITAFFFTQLDRRYEWLVYEFLYGVCLLSTLVTLTYSTKGLSSYPSHNGCMIALTLPIALWRLGKTSHAKYLQPLVFVLAVVAVLMTKSSVPVGVLAVVGALTSIWLYPPIVGIVGVAYLMQPKQMFTSSGRFEGWAVIWEWFISSGRIFFGQGTGASEIILGNSMLMGQTHPGMNWAHNDYLQVLFDHGAVGLGMLLSVFIFAAYASTSRRPLFCALMGYGGTMFFNFPLHTPLTAFVGASLVWLAFKGRYH
jgi:hypothetical protein